MLKRIAFTSGLFLLATNLFAGEMYMWQDSEGVKHFSDRPPQRDEKAKVKGEVTTNVLKVDRRPPKPSVSVKNNSERDGEELSASAQTKVESEREAANQSNPSPTEDSQ
ncbi:DUF4124 domain-containing protein [Neptuniibacter sp. SY11_33]|uniref:DUF4124 domain-containing protein n=1 Tax=Neptuniibacter sp. SY11_33 TaxID=3398215 RepID=UPI0039F4E134